jgi:methionyl-tRNA formyltransferase
MRIAFFGASALGYRCCEDLLDRDVDVCGIVTMPERFEISYAKGVVRNVTYRDFGQLAETQNVPLLRAERALTADDLETIQSWDPDFGLAVGWYYMLPAHVRALFPRGIAGIHASLLPRYRGGAPLVWALINDEHETGVTLFYLDDGVDSGDVIAQRAFSIESHDTIATLIVKTEASSLTLLRDVMPRIVDGSAPRTAQDESKATTFPQRSPDDGRIDWSQPADAIDRFVRAQTRPYPGAWMVVQGKRVTIWDAEVEQQRASVQD